MYTSSQQLKIKQHNNNNSKEYKRLNEKKERNNDIDMYACSIYNTNIPYRL